MTYKQIVLKFKHEYGITIKTCWIADVKRELGLTVRQAPNRLGDEVKYPCPPSLRNKIAQIIQG